jgi:ATP-binding cassette subfamily B protein/subfamily B ATP-binding cassette protein MsbA
VSIIIENLYYDYDGKEVLSNLCLHVKTGESVGIVGESGGGKSTLLKLVSGLYDVHRGSIRVMGVHDAPGRRAHTAMVLQNAPLFPASIRDNITCGHEMSDEVIRSACDAAKLTDWISTLPDGIHTFVGERGGKVSGGQAQRISIARAIAKNAPVILLDEPTSALDNDTGAALLTALEELTYGKTVLHVSHRPENLVKCDHICKLADGKLTTV